MVIILGITFFAFGVLPTWADCSTTNLTDVFNEKLQKYRPVFNAQWPTTAVNKGLDPYENVYSGTQNLGCEYGGSEICELNCELLDYCPCEKEYVSVDLTDITGIENMTMTSIDATQANLVSSCPYDSGKSDDSHSCIYSGVASANLSDYDVNFKLDSAKTIVKCKVEPFGPSYDETLYNGHGSCSVGSLDVTATLNICMGGTEAGPTTISYISLDKAEVKSTSDQKCDLSPKPVIKEITDVTDILLPEFSSAVEDVIDPVLEDAIDDAFLVTLPFSS